MVVKHMEAYEQCSHEFDVLIKTLRSLPFTPSGGQQSFITPVHCLNLMDTSALPIQGSCNQPCWVPNKSQTLLPLLIPKFVAGTVQMRMQSLAAAVPPGPSLPLHT